MSHTSLIAPARGLEELIARANSFISRARAASTVRAYRSDWNDFTRWCDSHRLQSFPATPETIALYITDLASRPLVVATIVRRLTAIPKAHAAAGHPSPASTRILSSPFIVERLAGGPASVNAGFIPTGACF